MIRNFALSFAFLSITLFASLPNVSDLSLDEKIGQLIMMATVSAPDLNSSFMQSQPYTLDPHDAQRMIEEHHVGGIIFLGAGTPEQQIEVTQQLQAISKHPLLIGLDAEWGLSMRHQKDVISFPRAMVLGAIAHENDELIYELGKEIGRQCAALGVHINFAPVSDVNNNPRNPIINTRSFGEDPEKVAHKASLFMKGMQDAGILACAKHFPGHGDTEVDSHHKRGIIPHDTSRLESVELVPFKQLIDEGVSAIMTAHLDVPALSPDEQVPATLSRSILTDLLRKKLEFKGLTVTDGLGMKGVTDDFAPGELEVKAIQAGNDILVCPVDVPRAIEAIKNAIKDGRITEQHIDERVVRILDAKKKGIKSQPLVFDKELLTSPYARDLKKRLYQAAVTIARDTKSQLPEKKDRPLKVTTFGNAEHFLVTLKRHHTDISHSGYPT
jgi:beta-N-acetylhexosaminidase